VFDEIFYLLGLGEVTAKCGHRTKVSGKIEVIDKKGEKKIGTIENVRDPEYCINCLEKKITVSDIGDIKQTKPIR